MRIPTVPGRTYVVTGVEEGEVTTRDGIVIAMSKVGEQISFIAPTTEAMFSDEKALVTMSLDGGVPIAGARIDYGTREKLREVRRETDGHIGDTEAHVREGERETWNKAGTDAAQALTDAANVGEELSAHATDTEAHVQEGEREAWNKAGTDAQKALEEAGAAAGRIEEQETRIGGIESEQAAIGERTEAAAAHAGDREIHVTAEERARWTAAAEYVESIQAEAAAKILKEKEAAKEVKKVGIFRKIWKVVKGGVDTGAVEGEEKVDKIKK